jgi:hypothetical protein
MTERTLYKILGSSLLIIMQLLVFLPKGYTEIYGTGPGIFQSSSLREKFIVSREVEGIFIVFMQPTDFQLFDPSKIDENALHVFFKYDSAESRFSKVVWGEHSLPINGDFTLKIGTMDVALANNYKSPYLTISIKDEKDPAIIGFKGLDLIVNQSSMEAIALLEANSFGESRANFINPYKFTKNGIYLRGRELDVGFLGVGADESNLNPCLKDGTIFIHNEVLIKIQRMKRKSERLDALRSLAATNILMNLIDDLLFLRQTKSKIIALDYRTGDVLLMTCHNKMFMSVETVTLD